MIYLNGSDGLIPKRMSLASVTKKNILIDLFELNKGAPYAS